MPFCCCGDVLDKEKAERELVPDASFEGHGDSQEGAKGDGLEQYIVSIGCSSKIASDVRGKLRALRHKSSSPNSCMVRHASSSRTSGVSYTRETAGSTTGFVRRQYCIAADRLQERSTAILLYHSTILKSLLRTYSSTARSHTNGSWILLPW